VQIDNVWGNQPKLPLDASRNPYQAKSAEATFVLMYDRLDSVQHVSHAAAIGDQMYFPNFSVLALAFDKKSDRAPNTTLAALNNVGHGEGCARRPGTDGRILICL
jgi:hypothetical protein